MKKYFEDSDESSKADSLNEKAPDYDLDLPVAPGFRNRPPKGTWEDGYRLSLLALEAVSGRPAIFEHRSRLMCPVEFVL